MTYKEAIKNIFEKKITALTCSQICKKLVAQGLVKERSEQYLSGSISGILNKMVKAGILMYDTSLKGPKGGYVYRLKQ